MLAVVGVADLTPERPEVQVVVATEVVPHKAPVGM
jgi:hypothetical protein